MLSSLLSPLIAFLCVSNSQTPIQPTVVNSTGQYYIASSDNSFRYDVIVCSEQNGDCFIECPVYGSCSHTQIYCESTLCDINCGYEACWYLVINSNITSITASHINVNCDHKGCESMTISQLQNTQQVIQFISNVLQR